MVLSYSRHLFLRFYFGASMSYFVRAHVDAFAYFDSVPRVLLYDNLRSAVLECSRDAIHFHPRLVELAAFYRFQPRPVALTDRALLRIALSKSRIDQQRKTVRKGQLRSGLGQRSRESLLLNE